MNVERSTQDFSKLDIFKFLKTYPYTYTQHAGLIYCPRNLDAESSLDVAFSVVKNQIVSDKVQDITINHAICQLPISMPPLQDEQISQASYNKQAITSGADKLSSQKSSSSSSSSPSDSGSSSSPSDSSEEYSFLKKSEARPAPPKPLANKIGLNLSIVSNHASAVASARGESSNCPLSDRESKQQKIEKYGPILSKITSFMFLSGIEPTQNETTLRSVGITHILNLCGDLDAKFFPNINYFKVRLKDATTDNVSCLFMECFAFIQHARDMGGKVVVHCHQGVSRSSSTCISYLMMSNDVSFEDAYCHCRMIRPVVSPNTGFIFQVLQWYKDMHHFTGNSVFCQKLKQKFVVDNLEHENKHTSKDSGVRDMMNSAFLKISITPRSKPKALLFKLTYLYTYQPMFLLKRIPTGNGRLYLDSRMIYLVPYYPGGTAIFIGKDIEVEDHLEQVEDVPPRDFYETNPIGLEFLKTYVDVEDVFKQIKDLRIPRLLKLALLRQLVLHILYQGFNPIIQVFYQTEMDCIEELDFSNQRFLNYIYIMSKLGVIEQEFDEIDGIISGEMMSLDDFKINYQFGRVDSMNFESEYISKLYKGLITVENAPVIPIPYILDKQDANCDDLDRKIVKQPSQPPVIPNKNIIISSSSESSTSLIPQVKPSIPITELKSDLVAPSKVIVDSLLPQSLGAEENDFLGNRNVQSLSSKSTSVAADGNKCSSSQSQHVLEQQIILPKDNTSSKNPFDDLFEDHLVQDVSHQIVAAQQQEIDLPEPLREEVVVEEPNLENLEEIVAYRSELLKTKPRSFGPMLKQFYVKVQDYNIGKSQDIERFFTRNACYHRVRGVLALNSQDEIIDWERLNLFNLMRLGKFDFRDGYTIDMVKEQQNQLTNKHAQEVFRVGEERFFQQDNGKMNYGNIRMLLINYLDAESFDQILSLLVQRSLEFQDFAYLCNFIQSLCVQYHEVEETY